MGRRWAWVGLLGCVCWASQVQAFQLCWNMQPFADRLFLIIEETPIGYAITQAMWRGPGLYQLLGSGSAGEGFPEPGPIADLGITLVNRSTFFSNNPSCTVHARLSTAPGPGFLNGPWRLMCLGENTPFTLPPGTMSYDPDCDGSVAATALDEALAAGKDGNQE